MLSFQPCFGLSKRCCQPNPLMLTLIILTWKGQVKAEWGPFAGLQRFVGPWLLIRAAGFFAFALQPDCVHSCTVACARISFPGYKKSTFLWYDSKILYRLCAKSHLFTKRLEPMWWRNKPPGSLILHPPSSHAPSGYPIICIYAAVPSSHLQRVAAPRASI